ncbi:unnamed protein product [Orchesella dallaii]|uniref:BTB domain-containing protein n=1 Tax=Orchesella dallaii TaxID=48710 RepID=A0ABP1R0G9_9HEXA
MSGFFWNFLPKIRGIVAPGNGEPRVVEDNALEPNVIEDEVIEPPVVENNAVVPNVIEDELIEPRFIENNAVEPNVIEDEVIEPHVVVNNAVAPNVIEDEVIEPRVVENNLVEPNVIEDEVIQPRVVENNAVEPNVVENELLQPRVVEGNLIEFRVIEEVIAEPGDVGRALAEPHAQRQDNRVEMRRVRKYERMKFEKTEMQNPAPVGNESVLYLVRDVKLFRRAAPKADVVVHSFVAELKKPKDMFHLNFHLYNRIGEDFCNLRISDARPLLMSSPMCLATFQQAEFLLQFFALDDEDLKLIHEEPSFSISLDYQHWQKDINRQKYSHRDFLTDFFSVTCLDVLPVSCVRSHRGSIKAGIHLRIHMKLMNGEVDVLHGIQKCFHPDKALHDLREKMETLLVEGIQSDTVITSGDNKSYNVHRAILAANSEIFKTMFEIDMSESNTGKVATPENISGKMLESILKYIYARNCKDLYDCPKSTTDILVAAHGYDMHDLMKNCEESLLSMQVEAFTLGSVLTTFQIANLLDMPALMTKCVHIIMRMNVDLSDSGTYMEFNKSYPRDAVKLTQMILRFKMAQPTP